MSKSPICILWFREKCQFHFESYDLFASLNCRINESHLGRRSDVCGQDFVDFAVGQSREEHVLSRHRREAYHCCALRRWMWSRHFVPRSIADRMHGVAFEWALDPSSSSYGMQVGHRRRSAIHNGPHRFCQGQFGPGARPRLGRPQRRLPATSLLRFSFGACWICRVHLASWRNCLAQKPLCHMPRRNSSSFYQTFVARYLGRLGCIRRHLASRLSKTLVIINARRPFLVLCAGVYSRAKSRVWRPWFQIHILFWARYFQGGACLLSGSPTLETRYAPLEHHLQWWSRFGLALHRAFRIGHFQNLLRRLSLCKRVEHWSYGLDRFESHSRESCEINSTSANGRTGRSDCLSRTFSRYRSDCASRHKGACRWPHFIEWLWKAVRPLGIPFFGALDEIFDWHFARYSWKFAPGQKPSQHAPCRLDISSGSCIAYETWASACRRRSSTKF